MFLRCMFPSTCHTLPQVTGLAAAANPSLLRVSVVVNTTVEPDVRRGEAPVPLLGSVEVALGEWAATGGSFTLYRFDSTAAVPLEPPFAPS